MTASAEDVIAAKIVCQLGLASPDIVRSSLRALDRIETGAGIDLVTDLFSRGAIDKAGRARVKKYAKLYQAVRRAAIESGLVTRNGLVSPQAIEAAVAALDATAYEKRLGERLVLMGALARESDVDLARESASALAAEDARVLARYRKDAFQGVDRALTKDRSALLDTGQFTIRKLFRSKESQRLAKLGELSKVRDEEATRKTAPFPPPGPAQLAGARPTATFASPAEPAPEISQRTPPSFTQMPGEETTGELAFNRLGPYLVLRKIGQGALGNVYLARRADLGKPVALEIVRGEGAASGERAFRRAAAVSGKVKSDHVLAVIDAGLIDGSAYLATENVQAESLRAVLAREGAREEERALATFRAVANGLRALHEAGLVHGDVRPEAILVGTRAGAIAHPKLASLSRSRAVGEASEPSSLAAYTAPETIARGPSDPRSDLYSLGVVLFEMLTGSLPFLGGSDEEVLEQHRSMPPRSLGEAKRDRSFSPALEEFVARLLAKEPEKRPPSAAHALRALDELVLPELAKRSDTARLGVKFDEMFRG